MEAALLTIEDLYLSYKVYRGELKVLDGVNLVLRSGERLGLVGESGCGKTTVGRCLVGLAKPASGRILFSLRPIENVLDLTSQNREQRKVIGKEIQMIHQHPGAALNPVFTIGTQIMTAIRYGIEEPLRKRQIRDRAIAALQEVQLPDQVRLMRSYPFQLSGGMRQRVCIAMALATQPKLLIADEPTTALDVTVQAEILRLLRALVSEKETALIFITHNLGVINEIAEVISIMYAGTIVETGNPQQLFVNPLHPYTQGLMEAIPKLTGGGVFMGIPGSIPSYLTPPSGCRFHPRCTARMRECEKKRPPLFTPKESHKVACFLYAEETDHGRDPFG